MKKFILLITAAAALAALPAAGMAQEKCPPNIGPFRVGVQAYTFRGDTFEVAIAKIARAGVNYVEAYPGQMFSESMPDVRFDHNASPEVRAKAREILNQHNVRLHNYGVVGLPNNETESRKVFDFAKDMGIEIIVSEPPADAFPLIEKLVKEYGIRVAIHNHPTPSAYADPATVVNAIKDLDKRIGGSPDTGHWMRSGFKPVSSLRMLNGRVLSVHLKDLKVMNDRGARDWPLGEGIADVPAILNELKRQKFDGTIIIEYEASQPDPSADVGKCISYLKEIAGPAPEEEEEK